MIPGFSELLCTSNLIHVHQDQAQAPLLKMGSAAFRVQNETQTYLYGQNRSEYPIFLKECTSDGWHYFQKLSVACCCYEWNEIREALRRVIRNAAITMHLALAGNLIDALTEMESHWSSVCVSSMFQPMFVVLCKRSY